MRMYEELGEAVANGEIDTDEYQLSLSSSAQSIICLCSCLMQFRGVADSGGGSEFLEAAFTASVHYSGEKYEIMENGNNHYCVHVSDSRAQWNI